MDPTHRQALAKWQKYYLPTINGPDQVVSHLLTLVDKCEASEAGSLKNSEVHLVKKLSCLKSKFDSVFESFLTKLTSLTSDVLMSALGSNPQNKDCSKLGQYWMALQLEIADKIKELTSFQNNMNTHCQKNTDEGQLRQLIKPKQSTNTIR